MTYHILLLFPSDVLFVSAFLLWCTVSRGRIKAFLVNYIIQLMHMQPFQFALLHRVTIEILSLGNCSESFLKRQTAGKVFGFAAVGQILFKL